jgi:predicted transcriptional regulator
MNQVNDPYCRFCGKYMLPVIDYSNSTAVVSPARAGVVVTDAIAKRMEELRKEIHILNW